jgi:hypothetical protein
MKWLKLIVIIHCISCSTTPNNLKETIFLIEESEEAVSSATDIVYYQIKENANKYHDSGLPLLRKADKIDSTIINCNTRLGELKASNHISKRGKYLDEYSMAIDNILQILDLESYDVPKKFQPKPPTLALDSLNAKTLVSFLKLNLSLFKFEVYKFLNLMAPFGIECWGPKSIYVVNEKIDDSTIQFDLASRRFNVEEDRYLIIDSVCRNGQSIQVDLDNWNQFTIERITIDSLLPGAYKVFGKLIAYPGGIEAIESFDHEFKIRGAAMK